jgi:alkylhydroperoxidase/carboxymuconolactone decarboxylase family protein YurZ
VTGPADAQLGAVAAPALAALATMRRAVFVDGALSRRDKHLISAAVHATRRDPAAVAEHLRAAREAGAGDGELLEIFLPTLLSHGPRAWTVAVAAALDARLIGMAPASAASGLDGPAGDADDALAYYRADLGGEPEWAAALARVAPGYLAGYTRLRREVLRDGRLPRKIKELTIVAAHAADRFAAGARFHVDGARRCGATVGELAETFLVAALAAGIPAWFEALPHLTSDVGDRTTPNPRRRRRRVRR